MSMASKLKELEAQRDRELDSIGTRFSTVTDTITRDMSPAEWARKNPYLTVLGAAVAGFAVGQLATHAVPKVAEKMAPSFSELKPRIAQAGAPMMDFSSMASAAAAPAMNQLTSMLTGVLAEVLPVAIAWVSKYFHGASMPSVDVANAGAATAEEDVIRGGRWGVRDEGPHQGNGHAGE